MVDTLEGSSLKCDDSWYDSMCAYEFKSWCWNKIKLRSGQHLFPFEKCKVIEVKGHMN